MGNSNQFHNQTGTGRQPTLLDKIGLVIIGTGASILYYSFETIVSPADRVSVIVPVAAILVISVFTQYLLNSIITHSPNLGQLSVNSILQNTAIVWAAVIVTRPTHPAVCGGH